MHVLYEIRIRLECKMVCNKGHVIETIIFVFSILRRDSSLRVRDSFARADD